MIRRLGCSLVDLVFPPRCAMCHRWEDQPANTLCQQCLDRITQERRKPACPTCARSVAPFEVASGLCRRCRLKRPRVAGAVRVGPYGPYLGNCLRTYKYHDRVEFGPILGGWLADAVEAAPWRDRVEAVVHVPTHWRRALRRPLHVSDALGSIIAGITGLPRAPVLRRTRAGRHQVGLSYSERVENVRGAFAVRKDVVLHHPVLLLIDDVKTTGATIDECAKVLRQAGAAEVYAAVTLHVDWSGSGSPVPVGM